MKSQGLLTVVALLVQANDPCVEIRSNLRAVFTFESSFSQATVDWCHNFDIQCSYLPRVSSPSLSVSTTARAFVDAAAANYTSLYSPIGLLVEDVFKVVDINQLNDTNQYSLKNHDAALATLVSLRKQLMGSFDGKFMPLIVAPQISFQAYFGNAFSITPWGDIYALFKEAGFYFQLMPVGKDDFVRFSAAQHTYYLSNWYSYNDNRIVIDVNEGPGATSLQASNSAFMTARNNQNLQGQEWESLPVMQQGERQYKLIIDTVCPPRTTTSTSTSTASTTPSSTSVPTGGRPLFSGSSLGIFVSFALIGFSGLILLL